MRKLLYVLVACVLVSGCAMKEKRTLESLKQPVNCDMAEGDVRVLKSEKVHVASEIAAGVTAIVPVSLVLGLVTRTEGTKFKVATGKYNEALDQRIAEIESTCGL